MQIDSKIIESLVLKGDISGLTPLQKTEYYNGLCHSLGLNPATQPFQVIKFQGKETLYAKKDATEQLRKIYGVSVCEMKHEQLSDVHFVTVKMQDSTGRTDFATGAVSIKGQAGETLANSIMKAETKAKRRGTLSICGLGMLDESELDTMPVHEVSSINEQPKPIEEKKQLAEPKQDAPKNANTAPWLKEMHEIGVKLYGKEWGAKRVTLCLAVSSKRTSLSKELTDTEASKLINGMKDKLKANNPDTKRSAVIIAKIKAIDNGIDFIQQEPEIKAEIKTIQDVLVRGILVKELEIKHNSFNTKG